MRYIVGLLISSSFLVLSVQEGMASDAPVQLTPMAEAAQERPIIFDGTPPETDDESEKPIARIQTGWTVEPFVRQNGFATNECVMTARYDNNLQVTFKGKNGQISALRVEDMDGKEASPIMGGVTLGLGDNSYGLQSRSLPGQVDASLLTVPAPAAKIMDSGVYNVRIGTEEYRLAVGDFAGAFHELVRCQGYENARTLKVVSDPLLKLPKKAMTEAPVMPAEPIDLVMAQDLTEGDKQDKAPSARQPSILRKEGKNIPLVMALPMVVPADYSFKLDRQVDPMKPISWSMKNDRGWADALEESMNAAGYGLVIEENAIRIGVGNAMEKTAMASDATKTSVWRANKGEALTAVLTRWAEKAGVKSQIDLTQDPDLKQDYAISGDLDIAVRQILQETLGNDGVNAVIEKQDGSVDDIVSAPMRPSNNISAKPSQEDDDYRWRALKGTDLRKVLKRWSVKEGVDFVWKPDQRFYVQDTVKEKTDYQQAVALLVSQYHNHPVRPSVQLNIDPETGRKALIVDLDKSL